MKGTKKTRLLAKPLPRLLVSSRHGIGTDPRRGSYLRFDCPEDPAAISEGETLTVEWTADGHEKVVKAVSLYKAPEGDFLIADTPFDLSTPWDIGVPGQLAAFNGKCRGDYRLD